MSRRGLGVLGAALLALGAGALPLGLRLADTYELDVRSVPWRTHGGHLSNEGRTGQGFRCRWDGLTRIEVALVSLGPTEGAQLELLLRADARDGAPLRRARALAPTPSGERGWVSFEFEPVANSAGRDFWFELAPLGDAQPSPWSAWIRYHGQPGIDAPWGDRVATGRVFEGAVIDNSLTPERLHFWGKVPHPQLCAMAFAVEELSSARGQVRLELWGEGADPRADPPLRSALLEPDAATRGGYAYFAFEPVADSRWKDMRYRLSVPQATRLVGFERGLSFKTFHGGTQGPPGLLGMTRGTRVHGDRSLVFRASSSPSRAEAFELLARRAGWKLWAGALCWILGTWLVLRLVSPR